MLQRQLFVATLSLGLLLSTVTGQPIASAETILIRPIAVYQSLIKGIHDYFNNTCVILLRGSSKPMEEEGEKKNSICLEYSNIGSGYRSRFAVIVSEMEQVEGLLALQRYFSGSLNIRTSIMDFRMFKDRVGKSYHRLKRPLFVILNDLENTKEQFVSVSRWIAMAYPTWLLFLSDESNYEDVLSEIYVPFDCLMAVTQRNTEGTGEILREVYNIQKGDRLRSSNFGTWNATGGFHGPRYGLFERRHDLDGYSMRVVVIQNLPVSQIIRDNVTNQPIGIEGLFGEILQLLQARMNCTYIFQEAESWGVRLPNGTWSGAIKMLLGNKADLAADGFTMTTNRLNAIEFTTPVYTTKSRVFIKRPDSTTVKWTTYLAPFSSNIWNAVALTILLTAFAILSIEGFSPRTPASHPQFANRFSELVFLVFGVFCGQGMEPSSLDPIRLVHLTVHLAAVVVIAAYSAALISFLAIQTFAMPFTTMEGLLEDGTYRLAVIADSAGYSFFQDTRDHTISLMFKKLLSKETDLPTNCLDGLRRICSETRYAFMTMDNMAAVLRGKVDCTFEPLDSIMQATVAMAVPERSPYRGLINTNILIMRDCGLLQRLLQREWTTNEYKVIDLSKSSRSTISNFFVSGEIGVVLGRTSRRYAATRFFAVGIYGRGSGAADRTTGPPRPRENSRCRGAATAGEIASDSIRLPDDRARRLRFADVNKLAKTPLVRPGECANIRQLRAYLRSVR
ncbi:glutamate receptor isoform X2 [Megachile rotundata]|uniref:glutamate receptor isoform X2 n=1 Tax=Megachile rotundata TaxID=143995 RepID=UPI0006150738|nr:PREDICTED: glutamate receptor-like isoform X2 [Megachile rotundata]